MRLPQIKIELDHHGEQWLETHGLPAIVIGVALSALLVVGGYFLSRLFCEAGMCCVTTSAAHR